MCLPKLRLGVSKALIEVLFGLLFIWKAREARRLWYLYSISRIFFDKKTSKMRFSKISERARGRVFVV